MVKVKDFWDLLKNNGYNFFCGVPCSILKGVLEEAIRDPDIVYIPAVKENIALGISSGAYLAGKKSGILIQNSGLGNIINALTSFNLIYKIPAMMFITWRGYRRKDTPEHLITGRKTLSLLRELDIPSIVLSQNFKKDIYWAIGQIKKKSVPVAVIIKKGILG